MAFSPDGARLVSGSADKTIKFWDLASGHETLTLKGHSGLVLGVAFGPDGKRLASAGFDGAVRLWDARPWTRQLRVESEARHWIRSYQRECNKKKELISHIERDPRLPAAVRTEALKMAEDCEDDPAGA